MIALGDTPWIRINSAYAASAVQRTAWGAGPRVTGGLELLSGEPPPGRCCRSSEMRGGGIRAAGGENEEDLSVLGDGGCTGPAVLNRVGVRPGEPPLGACRRFEPALGAGLGGGTATAIGGFAVARVSAGATAGDLSAT